ncbi:MAG: tail fiber domain-containing protein [Candidatus Aminicenantes bacterium]|nr:tail fiber domain-containing protein [Candidatus Aminicenantes bacterium]
MKRKKNLSTVVIFMFLFVSFWIGAEESKSSPIAVSPGSNEDVASVWQSCPTFSWSAVEKALSYRIVVFEVVDPKVMEYEEMAVMTSPVITKDIPGPALSYTLSSEESLTTGSMYTWYVQAVDAYGNTLGNWSNGSIFKVEQEVRFAGIEEKLAEKLREYGVNEETINNVLEDMKSEVKEVLVRSAGSKEADKKSSDFSGVLGYEGSENTFYGSFAGYSNSSGIFNTFIGCSAGYNSSTTYANTFVGALAGCNNTANDNTFIGSAAGYFTTTGEFNTFLGYNAGYYNTTGRYNTFLGMMAGRQNATGSENTFIGGSAGYNNTTGDNNVFVGYYSGNSNTTGISNTFIGHEAGKVNTSGYNNTFIGYTAGNSNTTGNKNIFLGYEAGYSCTTGASNALLGTCAGHYNTTGNNNTFLGNFSGRHNTTGSYNTYLGNTAGYYNTTGQGNLFLGCQAGYSETGSNKLYIANSETSSPLIYGEFDNNILAVHGWLGIGTKTPGWPMELETTGSNACFVVDRTDGATNYINATASFGNFGTVTNHPLRLVVNSTWQMKINPDGSLDMKNGATCTAGGAWLSASSRDLKEDIQSLSTCEALDALNKLNPVKYNYKVDKADKYVGFIAEDVPDLVATADRKGLSAMDITAVLTRVVQEQQKMIRDQQQVNRDYKKIISDLQERIAKIESEK